MGNATSAPVLIGGALENCCGSTKHKLTENKDFNGLSHCVIKGSVVLKKKNLMDTTDFVAHVADRFHEWFGRRISVQLISATCFDFANPRQGMLGEAAHIETWNSTLATAAAEEEATLNINFEWDESMGVPGAFLIKNNHHYEFYLKTLTLDNVPGHQGPVHFVCNSWVYPAHRYTNDRVFFANTTYLPINTPEPLRYYREQELNNLRGNGAGMLKEWDRVYDYDVYNDLGLPDKGKEFERPVLGGSKQYPYPRRTRTGRPSTKTDPLTESRLPLVSLDIYIPRDEKFSQIKLSEFLAYALKSTGQVLVAEIEGLIDQTPNEFDTFQDILKLYAGGIKKPNGVKPGSCIPWALVKELGRSDGEKSLKFPVPEVIKGDNSAWRTDDEFGREMLAGVNPVVIRRLQKFPPTSNLDRETYGDQNSKLTEAEVEKNMNGLTVEQALENNKLFILDHHDAIMPYLRRINEHTSTKTYASRTILLLQDDGTLKPLAIELSLPHDQGDLHGATSQVFTPAENGVEGAIWQLAKAYVAVNDSGVHQLISHWLNTHAVIEPFIIATHRQLSVLHPLHKLLQPHFKDTMNINALGRQILINAGGVVETTVFPSKYAMEMSAVVYKDWNLLDHALPTDLLKRGVAVHDPTQQNDLKLLIEDYPFAVDGLEIWSAISTYVAEYLSLYYSDDESVINDLELKNWWNDVRYKGHGDKSEESWWPIMHTRAELIDTCTIIIWVASALHAAVNFGQYPYAGYLPNRPTVSRRLMPEPGSEEYALLETEPDSVFLKTITAQLQTLLGVSLIEILSRHTSDELYLGQRDTHEWTSDERALEAFKKFSDKLVEIEGSIVNRNNDRKMKNRYGPVEIPYTLLYPCTSDPEKGKGLSGMGIPNSVSI